MERWWPGVRAAIVAFHVLAMTLSAIPSPEGGLNRATWADPTVKAEFAAWADRFGMPHDQFEDHIFELATVYGRGYKRLLTPVVPYEGLVGSEQSWKMFVAPHRFPTRLEIAARPTGGEWRVLFRESDDAATWRRDLLRNERLRSAIFRWGWPNYATAWGKGCTALAGLAFRDFPDIGEVRCRFWKAKSPSAADVTRGELPPGKWVSTRLVARGPDGGPLPAGKVDDEADEVTGSAVPVGASAPRGAGGEAPPATPPPAPTAPRVDR